MELITPEIVGIEYQDGMMKVVHAQRVGNILNANEEDRHNSDDNWQNADADIKKVGRIPKCVAMLWESLGIMDDSKLLLEALERNPEYKTTNKQIAKKGGTLYGKS